MSMETYAALAAGWIAGGTLASAMDNYKKGLRVSMTLDLLVVAVFFGGYYAVRYW